MTRGTETVRSRAIVNLNVSKKKMDGIRSWSLGRILVICIAWVLFIAAFEFVFPGGFGTGALMRPSAEPIGAVVAPTLEEVAIFGVAPSVVAFVVWFALRRFAS